MRTRLTFALMLIALFSGIQLFAQQNTEDKSKRPSPPATASQKIKSGATISVNYSQPSIKGRTIGKDLEPMEGKVWRTGANEATTFETNKEVNIQGSKLPAGKYALFTIFNGEAATIIFNKTWNQWGAYDYKEADDALRINTRVSNTSESKEKFTFKIDQTGLITLHWGTKKVDFTVM